MNAKKSGAVEIPADIMAELEGIPSTARGPEKTKFTPLQDRIILEQMPKRNKEDFSRWFNGKFGFGCTNTIRRRLKELERGEHE